MKNRPLIGVTLSFITGILVVNFLTIDLLSALLITTVLLIISLCLLISHRREYVFSILLLTFLTGIIYHQYRSSPFPSSNISHFVKNDKLPVRLRGIVLTDPVIRHMPPPPLSQQFRQNEITTFLMKIEAAGETPDIRTYGYRQKERTSHKQKENSPQLHWKKITGIVKVNVYPRITSHSLKQKEDTFKIRNQFTANSVKYGDRIELIGYISKPEAPHNPYQFDYKTYLQRQRPHIDVIANLISAKNIQLLSEKNGNYFSASIYRLKRKLTTILNRYITEDSAPLVCSILLGDREKVNHHLLDGFVKTGTMHFLAISGFHVGILVISLHFFLRLLGMNTKHATIIIIIFTFIYAAITGMKTPILRASIMVATFYGAYIFHRRWDLPNSISAAVLLILIINPSDLFNPGFQLSVLAILGIVCLSGRIENRLWKSTHLVEKLQANHERNTAWLLFRKYCRKTFCASAAAWFAVTPLIAYHFNIVTPLALLLNIVVLPLIWCILVGGFLVLLTGITIPVLAPLFAWIVSYSEIALKNIILTFSSNSTIFHYTAGLSWIWILIYYVVAALFVLRKSFRLKFEHMVIASLFLLNIFIFTGLLIKKNDFLHLTCFDVKHGTAIFIQFPNGKNMLFDSGTWSNYDVGERVVAPFLWKRKVETIDTIVISHEHEDHCNGIPSLIERFTVSNVFINKFLLQSGRKNELLKLISNENINIGLLSNGLEITGYEPAKITVLNPPDKDTMRHVGHAPHQLTANDASSVLLIEYMNYRIVLCADVGESGIKLFLSSMNISTDPSEDFIADILQVPHHGGFIENTEELIWRIRPKYAIISGNRSIISTATMKAYERSGAEVFKTYQDGAISFTIGKEGIIFSKFLND
ncbi:MAG: DNA internalization-related competence protein ComEC/Rec2 [Candidatus Scalindua sp.]|nr:DNA internalization-related competence protein ComEC/Rec2 [Candidatus Scalindua sp.]